MRFIFEEKDLSTTIKNVVKDLIKNYKESNGNINVEYLDPEYAEDYDFGEKYLNKGMDIYQVSQSVCGAWDQPLTLVAVGE